MKAHEMPEFKACLEVVMSFYSKDVTETVLDIWLSVCEPFSLEQIKGAFNAHVVNPENGQFAPKPADIVRLLWGTKTDQALIAWGKVFDAMSSVGSYSDVCFDDGVIHRVIEDMGGWPRLCRTEQKDLSFIQSQFCKSYQAYAARGEVVFLPRLQGLGGPDNEQMYASRGLAVPLPCFVGDEKKCKEVMALGSANTTPITRVGNCIPVRLKLTRKDAA